MAPTGSERLLLLIESSHPGVGQEPAFELQDLHADPCAVDLADRHATVGGDERVPADEPVERHRAGEPQHFGPDGRPMRNRLPLDRAPRFGMVGDPFPLRIRSAGGSEPAGFRSIDAANPPRLKLSTGADARLPMRCAAAAMNGAGAPSGQSVSTRIVFSEPG